MNSFWKSLAEALPADRESGDTGMPPSRGLVTGMQEVESWRAIVSGEAELRLSSEEGPAGAGAALRFDFDFHGSGGFVVARRELRLKLPCSYAVRFSFRGQGALNDVEVKWVDVAGSSVWRHVMRPGAWPEAWRAVELRDRDFPFAWGPAGGGGIRDVGAVELVVVAREGGRGTFWISDLELVDRTIYEAPLYSASSHLEGHPPGAAGEPLRESFWQSAPEDAAPVWTVDLRGERECGGLALRWARLPAPSFAVEGSADGESWTGLARQTGTESSISLAGFQAEVRFLRLRFFPDDEARLVALRSVEWLPREFAESRDAAFHTLAAMAPRGWFPRYWLREQSYWTPLGPPEGAPRGLMNEEGLVEPGWGGFSLEPFLWQDGRLITWAEVSLAHEQMEGWMPVPVTVWETGPWRLRIEAGAAEGACVVCYRLENQSIAPASVKLMVAVRPFQATPPWQAFRGFGGVGKLEALRREDPGSVLAGADAWVGCKPAPAGFGVAGSFGGSLLEKLAVGELPAEEEMRDGSGLAAGAFLWEADLAPGASLAVELTVASPGRVERGGTVVDTAAGRWRESALAAPSPAWEYRGGPPEMGELVRVMRGAAAHILVNRDGAALQPGPRRYQRCWVRDAAGMARALLYAGCRDEIRDLLEWYAPYVGEDGTVPCCVDREGPDWLPEHDSQGQFMHILAEYARYGGDPGAVGALWPVALRTMDRLEALRKTRMTEAYRAGNPPHRYGLLPESASHEGYLAHPVHAYWDDFWALRGLRDAAWLAGALGDKAQSGRLEALRDSFTETLAASLRGLVTDRGLDFVPGSVEWADFDPSATAIGLALLDELPGVPRDLLEKTFARYLTGFRQRRDGEVPWENYTPYEIRVIGAFIRMGWREEAGELLRRFLGDRRPPEWNQWPEIAWRNPRAPGHLGDVPHTWIGGEFVAAARSLFVFERDTDSALVLAAGLPASWLQFPGGIALRGWPTAHGPLTFELSMSGDAARLRLGPGLRLPPGGVVLSLPAPGALAGILVNGEAQQLPGDLQIRVGACPADVEIRFSHR